MEYIARISAIAGDALVVALTWIKTADAWRESRKIKGFKPTLSMLLLRDGMPSPWRLFPCRRPVFQVLCTLGEDLYLNIRHVSTDRMLGYC